MKKILLIGWCNDCNTEPATKDEVPSIEVDTSNVTVIAVCIAIVIVAIGVFILVILLTIFLRHKGKPSTV